VVFAGWLGGVGDGQGLAGGADGVDLIGFATLGPLKGNRGNQNYTIPAGTDLTKFQSAVMWCRRFLVGFAVAPLLP
jgi:hypothetical protein